MCACVCACVCTCVCMCVCVCVCVHVCVCMCALCYSKVLNIFIFASQSLRISLSQQCVHVRVSVYTCTYAGISSVCVMVCIIESKDECVNCVKQ